MMMSYLLYTTKYDYFFPNVRMLIRSSWGVKKKKTENVTIESAL